MSTIIAPSAPTPLALPPGPWPLPRPAPRQCAVLPHVRWQTYEMLLHDQAEERGIRLTYDRGWLQIMSPLREHESYSRLLAQFVRVAASEARIRYCCLGSSTLRREDLLRGIESADCFYLASLPLILGRRDLDLSRDPPPDLGLEIDITHSSLDRLAIYAALGIPEVWRFDGQVLRCYHRNAQGGYDEQPTSLSFPFLRVADVTPFLVQVFDRDEESLTEEFRHWLRPFVPPAAGPASS